MSYSRLQTAAAVVRCVQQFAKPMDDAPDLWQEYWDVRNSPGGNFTDEELDPLGITADQLGQAIVFLENFNNMMKGDAVSQNLYRVTVNAMRRVGAQI